MRKVKGLKEAKNGRNEVYRLKKGYYLMPKEKLPSEDGYQERTPPFILSVAS